MPVSAESTPQPTSVVERAIALCDFLADRQRLCTAPTRSVESYRSVLWYADLPDDPAITWPRGHAPDDTMPWLSVDRVERTSPPVPPDSVMPWVPEPELWDFRSSAPQMRDVIRVPDSVVGDDGKLSEIDVDDRREDHPDVDADYEAWLPSWQDWAADELARNDLVSLYQRLYAIYQDLTDNPQSYELVLAFGYLTCRSGGRDTKRHLITVPAGITLDTETGQLAVEPGGDTGEPRLEEDMLAEADQIRHPEREAVLEMLRTGGPLWGDDSFIATILDRWVNAVSSDGQYLHDFQPQRRMLQYPVVGYAPALVLRQRGQQPFIHAYSAIRAAIEASGRVPDGFAQLVEINDDPLDVGTDAAVEETDQELYFPEPVNADQRDVAHRLRRQSTVLVQGPPGTGKTHTIGNLLTHLLAEGKRVLVTSHTTRALRVLRDKVPPEVQDLCVRLTDDRPSARDDLEQSVETIQDKLADWTSGSLWRDLAGQREEQEDRREHARRQRAEALARLRDTRAWERDDTGPWIGNYRGTPQQIAERLRKEEPTLAWLGPVDSPAPRVASGDAREYLRFVRAATPELRQRAGTVVTAELEPDRFAELAHRIEEAQHRADDAADVKGSAAFDAVASLPRGDRDGLTAACRDAAGLHRELQTRPEPWIGRAIDDIRRGRDRSWRERHSMVVQALDAVAPHAAFLQGRRVTGLDGCDLVEATALVAAIRQRLAAGKKLTGPLGTKSRAAKDARTLLDTVRVDGERCETLPAADAVCAQLSIERVLRPAEQEWELHERGDDAPVPMRIARLRDETHPLAKVLWLADALHAVWRIAGRLPALAGRDLSAPDAWEHIGRCVDGVRDLELRREVESHLDLLVRSLRELAGRDDAAPAVEAMLAAVEARDIDAYSTAYARMQAAREANALLEDMARMRQLVAAGHADLARHIEQDPDDPAWDNRLPGLADAWHWSAMEARMRELSDPAAEQRWRAVLTRADQEIRNCQRRLAAIRGWAACLGRLTNNHAYHLNSYARVVRKIGKGTGKYAPRYREQARQHLSECQGAVPAWIMPLHRVVDSVSFASPHVFDVAIIDEASQSGLEALLLHWLARRVVVVGDDRQISPSDIGLDHDTVFALQRKHLRGLPNADLYGPATSLFDVADRLTHGGRIVLREHFRCMPEIIEFCNQRFYRGRLKPLRQHGTDRLDPVKTRYVENATVTGRFQTIANAAEAEAVAEQIEKCCADTAYDGKTLGVITLQGSRQSDRIRQLVSERLGTSEIEARRLRFGGPEDFQGDERDLVFLTMVAALEGEDGPRRIAPLSSEMHERRINVAVSRARDQLWLFHSVRPAELSTKDLRRQLLEYCLAPREDHDDIGIGSVSPDVQQPPFDSVFEQRVYLVLRDRGFRVRPQYEVAGRRIDLVVEGTTSRLAVECDGDAFHGPDTEQDDALRQAELERLGWTFWRVRGSVFFRNPEAALESLWTTLEERGIEPLDLPGAQGQPEEVVEPALPEPAPLLESVPVSERARSDEPPTMLRPRGRHRSPQGSEPVDNRAVQPQPDVSTVASRARARVQQEATAIRRRLNDPPPFPDTAARAETQGLRRGREREEARLEKRLEELRDVLARWAVDHEQSAGDRVIPGCVVGVGHRGKPGIDRYEITMMEPSDGNAPLKPDAPLARALQHREIGDAVSYLRPDGTRVSVIVESID